MVKETEINLPKYSGPSGAVDNMELVDKGNPLVLIGSGVRKGFGYVYSTDDNYVYFAAHSSIVATQRTPDCQFADGISGKALVIAENKTHSVVVLAAKRPQDWAAPNQKEMGQVRTGDTVRIVSRHDGHITAQVLEANWMPTKLDGRLEVRDISRALASRLGLSYSNEYIGAPCLHAGGGLAGFVVGQDPETRSALMVSAQGFNGFLRDVKDEFTKIMNDKGYKLEDIFKETIKYDDVRLKLAGVGVQFFLGFETIAMGKGSSARIHVIGVPTVVNVQGGVWVQPSYIAGAEALVSSPVNSNSEFMADFNRYRSTASCTLVAMNWLDLSTGNRTEIKEGDLAWEFALDLAASIGPNSIKAKLQWVPVDGQPPITKDYTFECNKEVEDTLPNGNGKTITRPISQLSSLVTNQEHMFMQMPAGIAPTTIDAFVSSQNQLGRVPYRNYPFHFNFPINRFPWDNPIHFNPIHFNPIHINLPHLHYF